MMQLLPLAMVLVSLLAGVIIFLLGEGRQSSRTVVNLSAAVAKIALVAYISMLVIIDEPPEFRLALLPGLDLVLRADALSLLFATLSAGLWLVTTVYAIAYLERTEHRARFFGFFSICVASTMGISMAGNLFTFFIFYELLTLATWPLVVHSGTRAAILGARTYLRYTLGGSAVFLVGLIWLYGLAGSRDFIAGGGLDEVGIEENLDLAIIFVLLVIGMGVKAALVPLHSWLPRAMVAPAPVSALLHAVAVVKAGAFGLVRLVEDVYGFELVAELGMDTMLTVAASITIVYGSVMALKQTDIKRRLAFSTVSQVSYIALGIAVGGALATTGGMVHLVHQGVMKITLFFCAGIFANLLGVKTIDQLDGVGRQMPWTGAAFTIAALAMIGLPPMAGFVSKYYLGAGAIAVGVWWVVPVLIASTLLNAAYFMPLIKRMWFHPVPEKWPAHEDPGRLVTAGLVVPTVITASLAVVLGLFAAHPLSPLSWVIGIVTEYFP
jgi:multicomponent Na+:H+ antiporter subunit D